MPTPGFLEQVIKLELRRPARIAYRIAASSVVGFPLILCWDKRWLPIPRAYTQTVLRDGRALRCQLSDRTQRTMYLGLFEPGETRLFNELLNPGDTFVDVGAHIGWFTTLAAQRVSPRGQVIAFEPYPANASALKENLALNSSQNVRVLEMALGGNPGTLSLHRGVDSGGVTGLNWVHDDQVDVPMTTLDEVIAGSTAIALLKIDVEGWEANVLRGGVDTLRRTRHVLIEINRPALKEAGSSPEELFHLLRSAGFTKFAKVTQPGVRRLHRSDEVLNFLVSR
jgi:FkbM family methyltransferase